MPSTDWRFDVVVGPALVVALASSGVGVVLAAAYAVHAMTFRRRPGRRTAVAVPTIEPTRRLIPELARITVHDYERRWPVTGRPSTPAARPTER